MSTTNWTFFIKYYRIIFPQNAYLCQLENIYGFSPYVISVSVMKINDRVIKTLNNVSRVKQCPL